MKIRCELVESCVTIGDEITTDYGLRFFYTNNSENTIMYYGDLFFNEENARSTVELLNGADISEVHIGEIIEDLICEYE